MAETVYLHEAQEFINEMNQNNKNLINALTSSINNLAMNIGNKTTREYNELKIKYEELEKNFNAVDTLLKDIITSYVLSIINRGCGAPAITSDNILKIMDSAYDNVQHLSGYPNDYLKSTITNISNEVYEKLRRR
jgi:hypothetical protein